MEINRSAGSLTECHIFDNIPAKRTVEHRSKLFLQSVIIPGFLVHTGKIFFSSENSRIYKGHQPMQIGEGILQRRRSQQNLRNPLCDLVQVFRTLALVKNIPQVMCLINDNKIPFHFWKSFHELGSVIIRCQYDTDIFPCFNPALCRMIIFFNCQAIEDSCLQPKFFIQFSFPLHTQCGRKSDHHLPGTHVQGITEG